MYIPFSRHSKAIPRSMASLPNRGREPILEIHEGLVRPQPPLQLFASDDLARLLDQRPEHLERLLLEPHLDPALAQLAAGEV